MPTKLKRYPVGQRSISAKSKPHRLKCKVGNFQCGARCIRVKYHSKRTGKDEYTNCRKNADGMAKTGLEWIKSRQERIEDINARRQDKRRSPIVLDQATGRIVKPKQSPSIGDRQKQSVARTSPTDRTIYDPQKGKAIAIRNGVIFNFPLQPGESPRHIEAHPSETSLTRHLTTRDLIEGAKSPSQPRQYEFRKAYRARQNIALENINPLTLTYTKSQDGQDYKRQNINNGVLSPDKLKEWVALNNPSKDDYEHFLGLKGTKALERLVELQSIPGIPDKNYVAKELAEHVRYPKQLVERVNSLSARESLELINYIYDKIESNAPGLKYVDSDGTRSYKSNLAKERLDSASIKNLTKEYLDRLEGLSPTTNTSKPKPKARKTAKPTTETMPIITPPPAGTIPLNLTGDRQVSAEAKAARVVLARPQITPPANPEIIPESIRGKLTAEQIHGVSLAYQALEKTGGFLLADGTGVGKTRQQLAIAKMYADQGKKVLIITPNQVARPNWKKGTVSGSFLDDSNALGVDLKISRGRDGDPAIAKGQITLSTYNYLSDLKSQVDKDTVIILDESHSLKNEKSQRTKHGLKMVEKAGRVVFASATPVDKPSHLPYLRKTGIFAGNSKEDIYRWLGLIERRINIPSGQVITEWKIPRGGSQAVYNRMKGLFDELTEQGGMIKREISLKGVSVSFEEIKLPAKAHQMLLEIEQAFDSDTVTGLDKALIRQHQRRQQEPYKIPAIVEATKAAIAKGDKVIIFASRVNESEVRIKNPFPPGTLDALKWEATIGQDAVVTSSDGTAKLLTESLTNSGFKVAELHGGSKSKAPQAIKDFQDGDADVVVATIDSAGVGINLDDIKGDRPRTMLLMTAPFSAVENVQAVGRAWRLNSQTYPEIKYFFGDTSVDEWNKKIIGEKMKTLGASVAGELGKLDPSMDDLLGFGDAEALSTFSPRPPKKEATPIGFYPNKFGGYTANGEYVEAMTGLGRREDGVYKLYKKEQVTPQGEIIPSPKAAKKTPEPEIFVKSKPISLADAATELAVLIKKAGFGKASPWTKKAGESRVYLADGYAKITESPDQSLQVTLYGVGQEQDMETIVEQFNRDFKVSTSAPTKPKPTPQAIRQETQKRYTDFVARNPTAIADPISVLEDAILELERNDDDRGRELNEMGWSGSTRGPGSSFASIIKNGGSLATLTDGQLGLAQKIVTVHRRQLGYDLPAIADIKNYLKIRDEVQNA